jgi:hypothetical protein
MIPKSESKITDNAAHSVFHLARLRSTPLAFGWFPKSWIASRTGLIF